MNQRSKGSDSQLPCFWAEQKMFHHVTDMENVLELRVNIPAVFVDRGQVRKLIPTFHTTPTN